MDKLPEGTDELLTMLEDYQPTVPEELTQHYMCRSGEECSDPKLTRLVSLAGQRFIAKILHETLQLAKKSAEGQSRAAGQSKRDRSKREKLVLTTSDLTAALEEHGINAKKALYHIKGGN